MARLRLHPISGKLAATGSTMSDDNKTSGNGKNPKKGGEFKVPPRTWVVWIAIFGGIVLHDEDVEGLYDEFIHSVHPMHNDYYLESDLDTFMKLKDFSKLDDQVETYSFDAEQYVSYWKGYPGNSNDVDKDVSLKILTDNAEIFSSLYSFDGKGQMKERYMTALFRKNEYKKEEQPI